MSEAAGVSDAPLPVDRMLSSCCCDVDDVEKRLPTSLMPVHRQVLAHWHARRDGRRATRQRDIDPSAIRSALPHLLIWEVDADDDYGCRLSGTKVDDAFGRPLKGGTLSRIPCRLIDDVRREFGAVREGGLACVAERTMGWAGKPYLFYRHLLLPLTRETDAVERLLSVMTFHSLEDAVGRAS
jgi:hypothetical protein